MKAVEVKRVEMWRVKRVEKWRELANKDKCECVCVCAYAYALIQTMYKYKKNFYYSHSLSSSGIRYHMTVCIYIYNVCVYVCVWEIPLASYITGQSQQLGRTRSTTCALKEELQSLGPARRLATWETLWDACDPPQKKKIWFKVRVFSLLLLLLILLLKLLFIVIIAITIIIIILIVIVLIVCT